MASDASRNGTRLDDEQVMASNVDVALLVAGLDNDFNLRRIERYLAVAWSSGVTPVVVLNKSDLADDVDGRLVAVDAIAPGVAVVAVSAWTGAGLDELARPSPTWHDGGHPGLVGRRQVDARQRAARRGPPGDRRGARIRLAWPPHDDPSRAVRAAGWRVARRHARHPGARGLGADEGVDAAFDDVVDIAATCRFSDCRHEGEPGCAIRAALADGRLTEERLASHRKLEREIARAAREGDPRARAEHRRTWKIIHKSVEEHMTRKYGAER